MDMKVFAHYQNNHQAPNKSISLSLRGEVAKRIPSSEDSAKIQNVFGVEISLSDQNKINRAPSELITEGVLFESPYNALELLNRVKYLSSTETANLLKAKKQDDISLILFGSFQEGSNDPDQVFCLRNNLGKFELAFIVEDENRTEKGTTNLKPIFALSEYQETEVLTPEVFVGSPEKVSDEEARLYQLASNAKYNLKNYLYPHKDDALITINALLSRNKDPKFWTKNRLEVLKVIDFRLYKDLKTLTNIMLEEAKNDWTPAHRFLINPTVFWIAPQPDAPLRLKAIREVTPTNNVEIDFSPSFPIKKEIPWHEQMNAFLLNPYLNLSSLDISRIVTEGISHQKHFTQEPNYSNKLSELARNEYFRAALLDALKSIRIDSLSEQFRLQENERTEFARILLKDKGISVVVKPMGERIQTNTLHSEARLAMERSQTDERNSHELLITQYFSGQNSIHPFEIVAAAISCDKKPNKSACLNDLLTRLAGEEPIKAQIQTQLTFDSSLISYFRSQRAAEPENRNPFAANVLRAEEFASVA